MSRRSAWPDSSTAWWPSTPTTEPVHPAKLWNDTESAPDAGWLIKQLGGAEAWADAVGSVPVAAFTATKLSWLHRSHPAEWERMARVVLPHDCLTHRLTGAYTTDRGDASGTGYWSPSTGEYRWDLLAVIDAERDWSTVVPTVLGPPTSPGSGTRSPSRSAPATTWPPRSDSASPRRRGVSLGTSGTAFTVAGSPTADPSGAVAGFADATGRFLPLVCTSNATKVPDAVARLLGVDHAEFDRLALAAVGDADVPVLLPYFDGERTPNRPDATGLLGGLRSDVTREQLARAASRASPAGCSTRSTHSGPMPGDRPGRPDRWWGEVVRAPCSSGRVARQPLVLAGIDQAVAAGAAVQAAAVAGGDDHATVQERWGLGVGSDAVEPVDSGGLRERYAELRELGR